MAVSKLFEQADAPAPADLSANLEIRLAAALDAEAAARRAVGDAWLARERGGPIAAVESAAERLQDAALLRQNIEAAIEAARLVEQATEAERQAAEARDKWAAVDELLSQRTEAVEALQRAAQAVAAALLVVNRLSVEIWDATPRRPQYMPGTWAMSHPLLVWLYAVTDGAVYVRGVIDSPYTLRRLPDLVEQAAADHAVIRGMRT